MQIKNATHFFTATATTTNHGEGAWAQTEFTRPLGTATSRSQWRVRQSKNPRVSKRVSDSYRREWALVPSNDHEDRPLKTENFTVQDTLPITPHARPGNIGSFYLSNNNSQQTTTTNFSSQSNPQPQLNHDVV
jgi:hypothetical protein